MNTTRMPRSTTPRRHYRAAAALAILALVVGYGVMVQPQSASAAGTVLVSESFSGASVSDPRFVPLGDACLTAAARPSTPPAGGSTLTYCRKTNGSPAVPPASPPPTSGWLQLTDTSGSSAGGVLFNQALPSSAGLKIEFDQAQYGGNGADGIGFFLADGSYNLTTTGAVGGSLGYANRNSEVGLTGGFLGIGLDAYGNYAPDSEGKGVGCATHPYTGRTPNAVTVRGPGVQSSSGAWLEGYCNLGTSVLNTSTQNLRSPTPAVGAAPESRRVQITVSPRAADGSVTVDVGISWDGGATYASLLSSVVVRDAPESIKFGYSGSTGGSNDVHLVRNVSVETINPLGAISLIKQENSSSTNYRAIYQAGDTIPYTFLVTNPGSSAITNIAVADPQVSSISCPSTTLAAAGRPGSSMTCSGTHLVTAAEVTSTTALVSYPNTATVIGTAAGVAVSSTDDYTVKLGVRGLAATKTPDRTSGLQRGDVVHYTFAVTNTGSIPIAPVTVTDANLGLTNAACTASLAAGATATCSTTATHTVTEADILNSRQYVNNVTASGALPLYVTGSPVTATAQATVTTVAPQAGLTLAKRPSVTSGVTVGQVVSYSFSVTNTGNVTLSPVRVDDAAIGLSAAQCVASLAPGATADCAATGSHTITDADVVAGSYVNTATATATPPTTSGLPPVTASGGATVTTVAARTGLTLSKTPSVASGAQVGQVVDYTFSVTNTGTITLSAITVSDPTTTLSSGVCVATLAPGASATCQATGTYRITDADVVAGIHVNTATATGTPVVAGPASPTATAQAGVTTVAASAAVGLTKTPDRTTGLAAGDVVTYSFVVSNPGTVTLHDVEVADGAVGYGPVTCAAQLAPGATAACSTTARHTVTQADLAAGRFDNTATVTGQPPLGSGLAAPTSTAGASILTVPGVASIQLVKAAIAPGPFAVGQTATFGFTVTNTGNITLAPVTITDARAGLQNAACVATLAPGATAACALTGSVAVTEADLIAGGVNNTATAYGTPAVGSLPTAQASSSASAPVVAAVASLSARKTADAASIVAGGTITYRFAATNTGTLTLHDITVSDPMLGIADAPCVDVLPPGATAECTTLARYQPRAAGTLSNTATLTGLTPPGFSLPSASDPATTAVLVTAPPPLAITGAEIMPTLVAGAIALISGLALLVMVRLRRVYRRV